MLGQWCKKVDSHGNPVAVMPCGGKFHNETVDSIRKKKGLKTAQELAEEAAKAKEQELDAQ